MATTKTAHPSPKSGYAYRTGKKRGWRKLSNEAWDTAVITPGTGYKFVGTRMIDGVKHLVWASKASYVAQTAASHGLGGLGVLKHGRKQVRRAVTLGIGRARSRSVKVDVGVQRSGAEYEGSVCLPSGSRWFTPMTPAARNLRDARGANRCGFGFGATPTKAISKAMHAFATQITKRK